MVKIYLDDINQLGRLPRMIVKLHPRGYVGSITEGWRGRGKSVFNLKAARQIFQYHYGITRDDAWEMVLKNILFSLEEVDKLFDILDHVDYSNLSEWTKEHTHICKIWDDAGLHAGKYKYQVAAKYVDHLQGNLDVMRIILTGFMINAPELGNLLKFIREYKDHIIIEIRGRYGKGSGESKYERVAYFQRWKKDRRGHWSIRESKPHTPFSCFLGNVKLTSVNDQWVYDEFERQKIEAIRKDRIEFKKMMNLAKKSEPEKEPWDAIGISKELYDVVQNEK